MYKINYIFFLFFSYLIFNYNIFDNSFDIFSANNLSYIDLLLSYGADFIIQIFGLSFFIIIDILLVIYIYYKKKINYKFFVYLLLPTVLLSIFLDNFIYKDFRAGGIVGLYISKYIICIFGEKYSFFIKLFIILAPILLFLNKLYTNLYFSIKSKIIFLLKDYLYKDKSDTATSNIYYDDYEDQYTGSVIIEDDALYYDDNDEDKNYSVDEDENIFVKPTGGNQLSLKSKADKNKYHSNFSISNYKYPNIDILYKSLLSPSNDDGMAFEKKISLEKILQDFGVQGCISDFNVGPVITLFEFIPAAGVKSSRVIGLADDIARSTSSLSARISVIPGKNALGIEIPNDNRQTVFLKTIIESDEYIKNNSILPIVLGVNIYGENIIDDLSSMPHLLIAGTTGSGKSVSLNSMIVSLLYKLPPNDCKFIMIDPKMLELSIYNEIPHLLTPVVTDAKKAVQILKWLVQEMESRYQLMSHIAVRNLDSYNNKIKDFSGDNFTITKKIQSGFDKDSGDILFEEITIILEHLPLIVVIVDEMADLMLVAGKDIEVLVQRLSQMARAAGIHLIMATQRPSVDVITGVIKANFPTRISFSVTSRIDSRTILGEHGAEQLLGKGDMLYMSPGKGITRVHAPLVTDSEIEDVVDFLKKQGKPNYCNMSIDEVSFDKTSDINDKDDVLYNEARSIIFRDKKVSISYIQRQLKIGYNRAANIIEKMEEDGLITKPNNSGKRELVDN